MLVLSLLLACSAASPAAAPRVIAVGDVHGDATALREVLQLAEVIDADGQWIGGDAVVVQVGDQLDRGDGEREVLDLLHRLRADAAQAGGAVVPLLGNHEVMTARGDWRYVTPGALAPFAPLAEGVEDPELERVKPEARGRYVAFKPGGPYAKRLATQPVIHIAQGTVFAHGGVLPAHVSYGVDRINTEAAAWLDGSGPFPEVLDGPDAPVWTRLYGGEADAKTCETLTHVLGALKAQRMVVAHTVQKGGVSEACDGRLWRVDVGLAAHYGGARQALQLQGDAATVLKGRPPAR